MRDTTVVFDIETHSADEKWERDPYDMFRLGGYAWGDGAVQITDDLDEFRYVLRAAEKIIGHNIHQFDLTVVFGKDSLEPFHMALDGKIYDTWSDAPVIEPYPHWYVNRKGVEKFISGPRDAMSYYSLDEMAHRWGTSAKVHDLNELAEQYGGFGNIPTTGKKFRDYLIGDVQASRELATAMLSSQPWTPYRAREQKLHGILAQCSRNGIAIDRDEAARRLDTLNERKNKHLTMLEEKYGMPTTGKQPLRTKKGKEAVFAALAEVGISKEDLPRTKTGNPSLGGKEVLATVKERAEKDPNNPLNEEAESLANSLAAISGARMTPETLLKHTHSDGRIHPGITALQRSARFSFIDPGLTVIGSRGDGANDKKILCASPGHLLVEFDFQAADTRAVCAYSGDEDFLRDYVLGDAHTKTAQLIWPDVPLLDNGKHPNRQEAKPATHGTAYRIGARRLSASTGLTVKKAKDFLKNLERAYPRRTRWQIETTNHGERKGYVISAWGRALPVDRDRAYNQSTAQLGQNATREMLVDILLRIPREVCRWLVGIIHDAALFDFPEEHAEEYSRIVMEAALPFDPPGGIKVDFPLVAGPPAKNWYDASH